MISELNALLVEGPACNPWDWSPIIVASFFAGAWVNSKIKSWRH